MNTDKLNREIDRHERTAEALRLSEETVQALLDATTETALLLDREGKILALNSIAFQRLKRLSPQRVGDRVDDMIGHYVFELMPPSIAKQRKARNDNVVRSGLPARFEDYRIGTWMDNTIYPIFDAQGEVTKLAVFSYDITDRKGAEIALQRALRDERERARHDSLTGVLNHRAIVEELQHIVDKAAKATSQAVFMLDIDRLKETNDTHGHITGDAVLVAIAAALCRDQAIVGRYGGDEFVAILPRADQDRAERFVSDIQAVIHMTEVPAERGGQLVPISASIGLAIYPHEAETVTKLIDLADRRMYVAKRTRSAVTDLREAA